MKFPLDSQQHVPNSSTLEPQDPGLPWLSTSRNFILRQIINSDKFSIKTNQTLVSYFLINKFNLSKMDPNPTQENHSNQMTQTKNQVYSIFTGGYDSHLKQWSSDLTAPKTLIRDYGEIHKTQITRIKASPDHKYIFTTGSDKILLQWRLANGSLYHDWGVILKEQWDGVMSMEITKNSKFLFIGSTYGQILQYKIRTLKLKKDYGEAFRDRRVLAMVSTSDSKYLFACGICAVIQFDVKNASVVKSYFGINHGNIFCMCLTPDDKFLFNTSEDRRFKQFALCEQDSKGIVYFLRIRGKGS